MKKCLALAALMVVGSVSAEELKFGDLNYFLPAGRHLAGADLIVNNNERATVSGIETNIQAYIFDAHYAFALSDRLNVAVGAGYLYNGKTETKNGGGEADAMGLQNPRIGANYRVLSQNAGSAFNLDLGATAMVKLMDREVGTPDEDGNSLDPLFSKFAEPRNTLDVNLRLGKKWDVANEFYVMAGPVFHMDGEYEQDVTTEVDQSLDIKAGAFYQYRPVNEFMLTVGATATRVGETDAEIDGIEATREEHMNYEALFSAKYLVREHTIVKFNLVQDRKDGFDIENVEYKKRRGFQYGLGVDFLL